MRALLFALVLTLAATGCRFEPRAEAPPAEATATPQAQPAAAATPTPRPDGAPAEVVLYVTEWCPYCAQAREYMTEQEIPHRVVDIENDPDGADEYRARGGTGPIPLVAIGDQTMEGWSAEYAREMLDTAGYK